MNAAKKISITTANEFMRRGNYEEAIEAYREITKRNPLFANFLQFNIDHCYRYLAPKKLTNRVHSTFASDDLEALRYFLHTSIQNLQRNNLPVKQTLRTLLCSCNSSQLHLGHLKAAVECGLSSPFQRDLLWYIASLAAKLGVTELIRVEESTSVVSLAKLIAIASCERDWFLLRHDVKNTLGCKIDDIRFWNLINNAPSVLVEADLMLPALKPIRAEYCWEKPNRQVRSSQIHSIGTIAMGTILLNESKFIGLNLMQHYEMCDTWTLVEGACHGYPTRKVSPDGLSLDCSAIQIRIFPDPHNKIKFIQHGWTHTTGEDAKSELRNRYLHDCNTDFLLVVDADEFYDRDDINTALIEFTDKNIHAVTLPQVHFWKNVKQFITGEYFDISHTRIYRNHFGMKYVTNHNFPEIGGHHTIKLGNKKFTRSIVKAGYEGYDYVGPRCYHMGFAKDYDDMRDKSDYYINRGEAITRKETTESRAAWFNDSLPEKCSVKEWTGTLPEVLKFY